MTFKFSFETMAEISESYKGGFVEFEKDISKSKPKAIFTLFEVALSHEEDGSLLEILYCVGVSGLEIIEPSIIKETYNGFSSFLWNTSDLEKALK